MLWQIMSITNIADMGKKCNALLNHVSVHWFLYEYALKLEKFYILIISSNFLSWGLLTTPKNYSCLVSSFNTSNNIVQNSTNIVLWQYSCIFLIRQSSAFFFLVFGSNCILCNHNSWPKLSWSFSLVRCCSQHCIRVLFTAFGGHD